MKNSASGAETTMPYSITGRAVSFNSIKKLISLFTFAFALTAVAGVSSLKAQTDILNETLRSGTIPAGWSQIDVAFPTAAGGYANVSGETGTLTTPPLDLTGFSNVELSFAVAKFGTGDNGPITVEISDDGGATFTAQTFDSPIPTSGTYLTSGPTAATASGSNVVIRFSAENSPSNKRLRDVLLTGDLAAGVALISAFPTSLSGFNYEENSGPSASQNYSLSAENLAPAAGDITVTAPAGFEVSVDETTWSSSLTTPYSDEGSTLTDATIYVRLIEGLSEGSYDGNITNEGGGTSADVFVDGNVDPEPVPPPPGYFVDFEGAGETKGSYATGTVTLSGIDWEMTEALIGTLAADVINGDRSARSRGYGVSEMKMTQDKPDGLGTVSFLYRAYGSDSQVPHVVEYSTNAGADWTQLGDTILGTATVQSFSEEVNIGGNGRIRIRTAPETGSSNSRFNADDILITDFAGAAAPSISADETNIEGLDYIENEGPSDALSYLLTAADLDPATGTIEVTAPADFEISSDNINWSGSLTLNYADAGDDIGDNQIFVRLAAGLTPGTYGGIVDHNGGGAVLSVNVSGEVEQEPADFLPALHDLSAGDYELNAWDGDEPAGTYPPNIRFYFSNDPGSFGYDRTDDGTRLFECAYNLGSRPRINGNGADGFSFINTGSAQHNDCDSGPADGDRFMGSAALGINTSGVAEARLEWTARLISQNGREYGVRPQYRLGDTGAYTDFHAATLFASTGLETGDFESFSFELPPAVLDEAEVYIRFVYYQLEDSPGGGRPEMGIDDILVTTEALPELLSCYTAIPFDEPVSLGTSSEDGVWYTDRYAPAAFETVLFEGDNRLLHSISSADAAVNRPAGQSTAFYDTQGRKYNLSSTEAVAYLSAELYVPEAWETTDRRMAGLWGAAVDTAGAVSAYPIIEFASTDGTPRFRAWDNGDWIDLGLPSGFVYDAFYRLEIRLLPSGEFEYRVGDLSIETSATSASASVEIENVILQGHNTETGVDYDIYWDNVVFGGANTTEFAAVLPEDITVGSGISNENMVVSEFCDVTAGIKAIERFVGDVVPDGNTYAFETGESPTSAGDPTPAEGLAKWNYVYSVNLGDATFEDLNVSLSIDFDPADGPGQTGPYVLDVSAFLISEGLGGLTGVQDSQNLGFDFWQAIGDPAILPFDPFAAGIYDISLSASTQEGAHLATAKMSVQVGCEIAAQQLIANTSKSPVAYYCSIQEAIDDADAGDEILLSAASYTEPNQIVIDKDLTLRGNGASQTVLKPGAPTLRTGNGVDDAFILITEGATAVLEDFTIDADGVDVHHGVQSRGELTAERMIIKNISHSANNYSGRGLVFFGGDSGNLVKDVTFENIRRIGIHIRGSVLTTDPVVSVEDVTYTGKGEGDHLDYAVEFGGGGKGTVDNLTASECKGEASVDNSTSAGILITDFFGTGTEATVTQSEIFNNTSGIVVGFNDTDESVAVISGNKIYDNTTSGVLSLGPAVDATNNWWGDASGPQNDFANLCALGNPATGDVAFSPWCADEDCTATGETDLPATPVYGSTLSSPISIGSGISNENMAVSQYCDIELGIKAFRRFRGDITPSGSTYQVGTGLSPASAANDTTDPGLARWNYLYSIDLGSATFEDLKVYLDIDFDPAEPSTTPAFTVDVSQFMADQGLGATSQLQDSQNLGFAFWQALGEANILPFDPYAEGVYDLAVRVEDNDGLELAFADMRVEVDCQYILPEDDIEAPVLTCPADFAVNTAPGTCGVTIENSAPEIFTDNCETNLTYEITGATTAAGSGNVDGVEFSAGVSTVTYFADDFNGNDAEPCSFTVTVTDDEAPTITAPMDLEVSTDPGICEATAPALGTPVTADNCAVASVTNDAPSTFPTGVTIVTWTVEDESGNIASDTQNVTVTDDEAPVITLNGDADVSLCAGQSYLDLGATAMDNCDGDLTTSITIDGIVDTDAPGEYTLTFQVSDAAGNAAATATRTVTVQPAPSVENTVTGPGYSQPMELGGSYAFTSCSGDELTTTVPATESLNPAACGDLRIQSEYISTLPNIPSATLDGSFAEAVLAGPQVISPTNVTGSDQTITFISTPYYDADASGSLTPSDVTGDPSTFSLTVQSAHDIACPDDITTVTDPGSCGAEVAFAANAEGTPAPALTYTVDGSEITSPHVFPTGATTVEVDAANVCGAASCSFTVTVTDDENPTITAPDNVTVSTDTGLCEATSVSLGTPITADNCSVASVTNDAPAAFPAGTTEVTWTAEDESGNTATAVQTVTVIDDESPVAVCVNITIDLDETETATITPTDVNGGSTDNCGIASIFLSQNTFTNDDAGMVTVTLVVEDLSGNTSTCEAIITVNPFLPGDDVCNALPIECDETATGSTVGYSTDDAPFCGVTNTSAGIWYSFTAGLTGTHAVDLCGSDFDTKVTVYSGSCEGLTCVGGSDDDERPGNPCGLQSYLEFEAQTGVEYFILVHGFGPEEGNYNLTVTCPCNVNGGTITPNKSTAVCVGTGETQFIGFTLTGAVGPNSVWAVTPANSLDVLTVAFNGPNFNWDTFDPGEYNVWHLSYGNNTSLSGITNGTQLEGCYDQSNPVKVTCAIVESGSITATSPTSLCVGEGVPKFVDATVTGAIGPRMRWGLLNSDNDIIDSKSQNPFFDIDQLSPGTYRLVHASFILASDVAGATNISELTGCIERTNLITIQALDCAASELRSQPNPTTGPSDVSFTPATTGKATLEVYDLSGRLVQTLFNADAEEGTTYRMHFDGSRLTNGVYLYRLTTNNEVLTDKFIIAH